MKPRRLQRGQALTEYALLIVVFAALLFVPVWPHPKGSGSLSTFGLFITAFDIYVDSFQSVISMPVP
ncbi:MAG: hypothetical protein AAFU77_07480 [Myxococcota bacterium]